MKRNWSSVSMFIDDNNLTIRQCGGDIVGGLLNNIISDLLE